MAMSQIVALLQKNFRLLNVDAIRLHQTLYLVEKKFFATEPI